MPVIRDGKQLVAGERDGKALVGVYVGAEQVWPAGGEFEPTLVTIDEPGAYSVPWPSGATHCDRVLLGAGGGGGGALGIDGQRGGDTTSYVGGVDLLTADGGHGGYSSYAGSPQNGESPGNKAWNGETYPGGVGGTGGATPLPGGTGAGGGGHYFSDWGLSGEGGYAGIWNADTVTTPGTITGTVGAGGDGYGGGGGGDGIAHFYFYGGTPPPAEVTVTLTIAPQADDLTGFPLYIDLADMPEPFWSKVTEGGGDIRCHAGEVELAREVVSCDTTAQTGELWVKTDLSDSADTVITLSVDGIAADYAPDDAHGAQAVW